MEFPEQGIVYIKKNKRIAIRSRDSTDNQYILGYIGYGDYIIYDKKISKENKTFLSFVKGERKYFIADKNDISLAPLINGVYSFENIYTIFHKINFQKILFECIFIPDEESYMIKLFNLNKYLSIIEDIDLTIKFAEKQQKDIQTWKIKIDLNYPNICEIENNFCNLFLSYNQEKGKFIAEQKKTVNFESQKFYFYEEFHRSQLNFIFPFKFITKKMVERKNNIKYVNISNSVEIIESEDIFSQCRLLEKVKCGLKWLKYFLNNNITSIEINEGEIEIKKIDFIGFENINEIKLPKSLNSIEEDTFSDFDKLLDKTKINTELKWYKYFKIENLTLPNEITILKREVFSNSKYLKHVKLHKNVKELEEGVFENSAIEDIDIPDGVEIIPKNSFKNCVNLKKIILPKTIRSISHFAFINCKNLKTENIITLNANFNGLIIKEIKINEDKIDINKYSKYIGVETLHISINSKFSNNSEKDKKFFFGNFECISEGCFSPEYLKYANFSNLVRFKIPYGISEIKEKYFDKCTNLEYLEISDNINPGYFPYDIFFKLINLKEIKVPTYFKAYKDNLFQKCYNLMKIIYVKDGEEYTENFKTKYEIPPYTENVQIKNLVKIKNLGTLIIPKFVKFIEKSNDFDLSGYLECVECDPKWLIFLPIYQLKKIIIPEFVEEVDEIYFEGGRKIEELIFKGKSKLKGNRCKSFENIKIFRCFPEIGLNPNINLKYSEKIIYINEGTISINQKSFENWKGLKRIHFPNTLKYIDKEAFCNCINLEEIEIPKSVVFIDKSSFKNCINIRKIVCKAEFLDCFPPNNVKKIIIDENTNKINEVNLKCFKNLIELEIPEKFKTIEKNFLSSLPNIKKIKCSPELLEMLSPEEKLRIQEIEFYEHHNNTSENLLKNFRNVQDLRLNNTEKMNHLNFIPHETTIEDILKFDPSNKEFEYYIKNILNDIKTESFTNYPPNDVLGAISQEIVKVCLKIKAFTNGKMSPHPVQCFAMLRLIFETLYNKELYGKRGVLAEIATGEGKSYIIGVVAIVLAGKFRRKVDIVTSNLELAFRDEKEQSEYYKLFNLQSGVLCSEDADKEYITLYQKKYKNLYHGFYIDVLDYPIIYSANYNYQFLHLFSFGEKENLRMKKRKYDIVIVDEVDNMLLDKMSYPSIVGSTFNLSKMKEILKDFYNNKNINDDVLLERLGKKYSKDANINKEIVTLLKNSSNEAKELENYVDYVVKNNRIYIIDKSTGYIQENLRYFNYIHELVEVKEGVKVKKPIFRHSLINQKIFFNFYENICGVTGTLGDLSDHDLLEKHYNINIFKVPRHKARIKPIYIKERPYDIRQLFKLVHDEIIFETGKNRPILIIMDSPKHINDFIRIYSNDKRFYTKIDGLDIQEGKNAVEMAGYPGQVTLATSAGGRGTDIKLDKISINSGGLHVIIPFQMINKRNEDQAIGRSGRQGQPGSVTIYRGLNDRYTETPNFNEKEEIIFKYQNKFNDLITSQYDWIFNKTRNYFSWIYYKFNISFEECLSFSNNVMFKTSIIDYIYGKDEAFIKSVYNSLLDTWCIYFNNLNGYIKEMNNEDIENDFNNFLKVAYTWFPPRVGKEQCFQNLIDKLKLRAKYNRIIETKAKIEQAIALENQRKREINNNNIINHENIIKNTGGPPNISEFLKVKFNLINLALFNIDIGFNITGPEIIISYIPLIKCKFNYSVSKSMSFPEQETYTFENDYLTSTIESKFDPLKIQFNNFLGIDSISSTYSINSKLGPIINKGSITISYGIREIAITFSFGQSNSNSNISSALCLTYIIDFNSIQKQRQLVPAPSLALLPKIEARANLPNRIPNFPPKKQRIFDPFNRDINEYGFFNNNNYWEEIDPEVERDQLFLRLGIYGTVFGAVAVPVFGSILFRGIGVSILEGMKQLIVKLPKLMPAPG